MIVFSPFHWGYERIKPDAFYVGVEGYLAPIFTNEGAVLLDTQLRMGYNFFFNGRDHLTPIAGVGFVRDVFEKHHDQPGVVYGTVGLLYNHEVNTIFNLGLDVEFLMGGTVGKNRFEWGSPVVGIDVSFPITLRFGHRRHWDYRIEPFNLYLHGPHNSEDYWGFRNSLAYRF